MMTDETMKAKYSLQLYRKFLSLRHEFDTDHNVKVCLESYLLQWEKDLITYEFGIGGVITSYVRNHLMNENESADIIRFKDNLKFHFINPVVNLSNCDAVKTFIEDFLSL